jgi:hypothetical protein
MKKPYLFFLIFFMCVSSSAQKRVTAAASVDKKTILIGEPLQLTLTATFSKPHAPSFFLLDSLRHFEILNRSKIDTQATGEQTILKQTLSLTSWDSGKWAIPALAMAGARGVSTKPVVIDVMFTPMPPNQDYHDIKDIIEVQKPQRTTWYWYLIGAVLLLLIGRLLFPKKKRDHVAAAAIIKEDAYKLALKELDSLKNKNGLDDKTYFTELILIFRTYLEQGKGIHSFQQTTDDLSRQLQALQLPHGDFKKLMHTLQLSDFVKFAQYKTASGEREQAWDEVRKTIVMIEQIKK